MSWPRISALALDPIEKKPLACYMPGSMILSAGFFGCSMRCPFCQNSSISQQRSDCSSEGRQISPEALVQQALSLVPEGNIGIAYTYSEPLVHIPYLRECAGLAREAGLRNILVTNGFASEAAARSLFPLIDAANIDLKAFSQGFYDWVGAPGGLEAVKRTISIAATETPCHVEVTTLVIPGRNDDPGSMSAQARWLASLDPMLPLHITRFFPSYKMLDTKPTPRSTIFSLVDVAKRHLSRVYAGNM